MTLLKLTVAERKGLHDTGGLCDSPPEEDTIMNGLAWKSVTSPTT